jgi:hypothetical protein
MDKAEGLIECVDSAHSFLDFKAPIDDKNSSSTNALKNFIESEPERKANLFRTFLGFVVSGIVLQLADRHGKAYCHVFNEICSLQYKRRDDGDRERESELSRNMSTISRLRQLLIEFVIFNHV